MSDNCMMALATTLRFRDGKYDGGDTVEGAPADYRLLAPEPGQNGPVVVGIRVPSGFTGSICILPDVPTVISEDGTDDLLEALRAAGFGPQNNRKSMMCEKHPDWVLTMCVDYGPCYEQRIVAEAAKAGITVTFEDAPVTSAAILIPDGNGGVREMTVEAHAASLVAADSIEFDLPEDKTSAIVPEAPINGSGYFVADEDRDCAHAA